MPDNPLSKYMIEDTGNNPLSKYMTEPSYGEKFTKEIPKTIFPIMKKVFSEVTPQNIITGMLPYRAGEGIRQGVLDISLPKGLKTGLPRVAIDIATDPATYAGLFVGGPKVAIKAGKILRSGTGISSDSARWIKTRGAKNIFTPEKESIDFIKTHLAPQVQKDVEKATVGVIRKAEILFSRAEGKLKADSVELGNMFNNAKQILNNYGLLDSGGRVLPAVSSEEIPRAIKVIAKMYTDVLPATGKVTGVGPVVNKGFFKFYRQLLRDVQGSAGAFKKDIQFVIEGLYDDMEKAGAIGIKKAKELFRKSTQFEEEFGLSPNQISTKLQTAVNPKDTVFIERQLQPVLGSKTKKIFQAIKDHRVAQEFVQRGRPPWTKTGIFLGRPGRQVLKMIYEKKYPLPSIK